MAKPLIFADSRPAPDRHDPATMRGFDPSYIPGYAEAVQANEIAAADDLAFMQAHRAEGSRIRTKEDVYRIIGTNPRELDVEFSWQRVVAPNGSNSYSAAVQLDNAMQEGWEPASEDDLTSRGFSFPPTAHKEADGTIRRRDVALFKRSAEAARKWNRYRAEQAQLAEGTLPEEFRGDKTSTSVSFEKTVERG